MGRIIMVVTVWLVMVAMMLVIALPVIADNSGEQKVPGVQGPPLESGGGNANSSSVLHKPVVSPDGATGGTCVLHQGGTGKVTGGCEVT